MASKICPRCGFTFENNLEDGKGLSNQEAEDYLEVMVVGGGSVNIKQAARWLGKPERWPYYHLRKIAKKHPDEILRPDPNKRGWYGLLSIEQIGAAIDKHYRNTQGRVDTLMRDIDNAAQVYLNSGDPQYQQLATQVCDTFFGFGPGLPNVQQMRRLSNGENITADGRQFEIIGDIEIIPRPNSTEEDI